MASTGATAPALDAERLEELLKLTAGADSVELKLTVPESDQYATAAALGVDPLNAQIRQVYFFDTPDLDLNRAGVVVRGRRVQGKRGDTVVKLRPVVPDQVPKRLRKSPGFVVEVDAVPGSFVCSGTLKGKVDNAAVREVAFGQRSLDNLLSEDQQKLYAEHAPGEIGLKDLTLLGPILVLKLKYQPEGYDRQLVLELWSYPDSSRVLELSTKCEPRDAFQVAAETRVLLAKRGIDLSGDQQTKTKKALEFFAGRLASQA